MTDEKQPEKIISEHAVTERWRCYAMRDKYGWRLLQIERTNDKTLKWNCIFEGKTEFSNYMENEK